MKFLSRVFLPDRFPVEWFLLLLTSSWVSLATQASGAPISTPKVTARPLVPREIFVEPSYVDTIRTPKSWQGKDSFFGVGYSADARLFGQKGLQLFLGSQGDLIFGYFFRLNMALANFGVYRARPDGSVTAPTGLTSQANPNSEVNRARFTDDSWIQATGEVGFQSNIRLLSGLLPRWSQVMRNSLGYGYFRDGSNGLGFLGLYYGFDAGMQYHFNEKSPYALDFAAGFRVGEARRMGEGSVQDRRLPMLWTHLGLSLLIFY
jgi:hypothetical protein